MQPQRRLPWQRAPQADIPLNATEHFAGPIALCPMVASVPYPCASVPSVDNSPKPPLGKSGLSRQKGTGDIFLILDPRRWMALAVQFSRGRLSGHRDIANESS